jgi:hypothetical protein
VKSAFFIIVLLSILPMVLLLRRYEAIARVFWICFGAAPFFLATVPLFDIGLISWGDRWVGFVYGMELSVIDFLAILAFFTLPRSHTPLLWFAPLVLYILAAAFSMLQAAEPLAAFFGVWQFMRMLFIAAIVARACAFEEIPHLLLRGMALGMAAQFVAVLWQRYGLGYTQTPGLFIHQNTLGMAVHFVLLPYFALLLAGRRKLVFISAVLAATLVTTVFTASRATVGFAAMGLATTFVVFAMAGLSQRKIAVAFAALVAAAVIVPVTMQAFQQRFERAPLTENEYDERAAFDRAAAFILEDYPLGVGMNHYVPVARDHGYSERAGVAVAEGNRNNIVHNAFRLAGAETGYPGMIAFCLMLATPLALSLTTGWRQRATESGTLLLGFAMAMLFVYLHSFYEWILFGKEVQYLLSMTMGMTFGIAARGRARSDDRAFRVQREPEAF